MDRTIAISEFPELMQFGDAGPFELKIDKREEERNLFVYSIHLKSESKSSPKPISLRWKLPSKHVNGVWKPGGLHDKRLQYDWELEHVKSRISVNAPVLSVFGHDDRNVITFACSDAINLLEMNALLREEDQHLYCHLALFTERHPEIFEYSAELRIDVRKQSFHQSLKDCSLWWESFDASKPATVPPLAKLPLYSTWYNFHQDLNEEILLKECRIAKDMGYELIILDDGWQTLDTNRGYDYTGDWQPDRFPDMAGFVEKVHETGMKIGIWYSVPFCGKKSQAYKKFHGKFLTENHRWAPVFDPRYPEVREHLIGLYTHAVRSWKLDALKLDFIDDFKVYPETVLTRENGRDYANVNEGVDRLLSDAKKALTEIRPDIAIEFRQQYIGPVMRKFGNMFRAFDCPIDPVSNRIRITDVKLLCGNSAVHSDMLIWHPEEEVEVAALQLLNAFFGVPQMSVHLRNTPEEYLQMITHYTSFWKQHAELIMDGNFIPHNPLGNYPILEAEKGGHRIIGVYDEMLTPVGDAHIIDLINAKSSANLAIRYEGLEHIFLLRSWDCRGNLKLSEKLRLGKGLFELRVPPAGRLRLEKVQ
ncbi:MAG: glycoside hydrolase family 36 protein [Bacteroidota bacterium]